jgi:hypothetical protein
MHQYAANEVVLVLIWFKQSCIRIVCTPLSLNVFVTLATQ